MSWQDTILSVIDLHTFANIWYWFAVIVAWAVASHWLIGVPFDLLFRARRGEGQEIVDLEAIVDINVRRFTYVADLAGPYLMGFVTFILSGLGMAGFYYGSELGQGLFILGAPLTVIGFLNMRLAYQLRAQPVRGRDLVARLFSLRIWTQAVGMVAIFFTAVYGMVFNLDQMMRL